MSRKKSCVKSAIEKYGREQFASVILLAGIVKEKELNLTEIALIEALDCLAPGNRGYNIHPGGRGGAMSKETREKMSDAHKGRLMTVSHKAAISAGKKGKARSDEARAAISAGLKAMKKAVIITLLKTSFGIIIF
jgi:hypothetical protein